MFTSGKILGGLVGIGLLVLGSTANAVVVSNPVLTAPGAYFLGTITPGGGNPSTERNNINFLITLGAGDPQESCGASGDMCDRIGSTLAGPFDTATLGGKQDNGNTSVNLGTKVYQYILGKYDNKKAGSWVWYNADGFTGTVTMPGTFGDQALSHTTYFSKLDTTSSSGGNVPEPGTMALLGLGLVGLGFLRRSKKAA